MSLRRAAFISVLALCVADAGAQQQQTNRGSDANATRCGAPSRPGRHYHTGPHAATPADWQAFMVFLDKYFPSSKESKESKEL